MNAFDKSNQAEKIRLFLQNCRQDPNLNCLDKFREKSVQPLSLIDEIDRTINVFKINELLQQTSLSNKRNELTKIANRLLTESRSTRKQSHAKPGPSAGPTEESNKGNFFKKHNERTEEKLPSSGNTSKSTGYSNFNQKMKAKGNVNISSPRNVQQSDGSEGFRESQRDEKPISSGGSFSGFNQRLKANASNINVSSSNASGCVDFNHEKVLNQCIPPLLNIDFNQGPKRGGPIGNAFSNRRGQGGRNRGGNRSRGLGQASRGMQPGSFNHSVDNIPDLSFGQPRGRRNSNASEASSTISENPNFRSRRNQNYNNSQNVTGGQSQICPLCFEDFETRRELAIHLQRRCMVVKEGSYKFREPNGFSLFQIVEGGILCNPCKLRIVDNWTENHKRAEHSNDPNVQKCLVNLLFCAICREYVPADTISHHRDSTLHKELTVMRGIEPKNKIVLLRQNSYCMLCRTFQPGHVPLEQHLSSQRHAGKAQTPECEIWCHPCGSNIGKSHNQVRGHLMSNFHKDNSAPNFYCPFCVLDYKLDGFVNHIVGCVQSI